MLIPICVVACSGGCMNRARKKFSVLVCVPALLARSNVMTWSSKMKQTNHNDKGSGKKVIVHHLCRGRLGPQPIQRKRHIHQQHRKYSFRPDYLFISFGSCYFLMFSSHARQNVIIFLQTWITILPMFGYRYNCNVRMLCWFPISWLTVVIPHPSLKYPICQ